MQVSLEALAILHVHVRWSGLCICSCASEQWWTVDIWSKERGILIKAAVCEPIASRRDVHATLLQLFVSHLLDALSQSVKYSSLS